jgi:CheY-like chemotaxis protein/HPt (histidine-containing phosphotransfer) domain-containing protein
VTSSISAAGSAGTSARVLVVDDDPLSSSLQAHLALLLGHTATIEHDAERAVELALSGDFDLMLLDLGMPKVDGFEALRRLREHEKHDEKIPLPVIAVTGYSSESDRLSCLMAGFNEHLSKPVQAASLASAIERALGTRSPPRQDAERRVQESDAQRLRATVRRLSSVKPGDRQFAPTVTESFALRSAQLIETLNRAVETRDAAEAARAARALKASAEFLGALRLAQMSAELDRLAADDAWPAAAELLRAVGHEHQAVLTLLFESAR